MVGISRKERYLKLSMFNSNNVISHRISNKIRTDVAIVDKLSAIIVCIVLIRLDNSLSQSEMRVKG